MCYILIYYVTLLILYYIILYYYYYYSNPYKFHVAETISVPTVQIRSWSTERLGNLSIFT